MVGVPSFSPDPMIEYQVICGQLGFVVSKEKMPQLVGYFAADFPAIKRALKEVMDAKAEFQQKLTQFYEKTAELVWLIGNTQPLMRGSGTVAEWLFALVHFKHDLPIPVLKTTFPQLDVLDITIPLSDYKKLFLHFFESSTIPLHLRQPVAPAPTGSLLNEMQAQFERLNK